MQQLSVLRNMLKQSLTYQKAKDDDVDLCAYSRVNLGYMELLKEEAITGVTPEGSAPLTVRHLECPFLTL